MQDVLLQFHHCLPAVVMAMVMPVVMMVTVVMMMVMPMMVVVMTMVMMVTVVVMMVMLMMVVVMPFLRRQRYFWPLGITATSANSAHIYSRLIIGRCRLRGFVHDESHGLHIQLFAGNDIFEIAVAVRAGIEMMLQRKRLFTLKAYRLPICTFNDSISPFEGGTGYSRRPNEIQGLQLHTSQCSDLKRDGLNAGSA